MRERSWKCKWNLQCREEGSTFSKAHKNPTETNCDDHQQGETHSTPGSEKRRTTYACTIEAHEYVRKSTTETQHKDREDPMAERRFQFVESSQSCAQTGSHTPCNENSGRKRRSRQGVGEIEGPASMARDESQKQKRGHLAGTKRRQNSSFCDAHGLVPLDSELEPEFTNNIMAASYYERTL